jgi:hypothetical protein
MELAELEGRRDELIRVVQAQTTKAEEIKTAALINRGRLEEVLLMIAALQAKQEEGEQE